VRGRESIADEHLPELRELLRELRIVLLLSWIEAKVLKKENLTILKIMSELCNFRSDAVGSHDYIGVQELRQSTTDRLQRECRLTPVRLTEVRHEDSSPTLLKNVLEGWQEFLDTIVVGDLLRFVERDVKVRANENPFSFDS
jgi:hypothetical protein